MEWRIKYAPLSGRFVIARFGKDKEVALETIDATNDFLQALLTHAFGKIPEEGSSTKFTFGGGNEQFECQIKRLTTTSK